MKGILLVLAFCCVSSYAQDAATWASQQAAEQANQQAMWATQQAMQQNMQAAQAATDDANNALQQQDTGPVVAVTMTPSFSVKAGTVAKGATVRIKCRTHYATIYYTTNGWTPTTASRRYKGPITINATTQLQAVAIAPNMARSAIVSAKYSVLGTQSSSIKPLALGIDGVLHSGTRLHLVTASAVSSKTAQVGDSLSVMLDQDVKVGATVVVPKGTPVEAVITQADSAGAAGGPGDVAFEVSSLSVGGKQIVLKGGESLEGPNRYKSRGLLLIPVVGVASLAIHGGEAEIKPGMALTASVAADVPLKP